LPKTRRKNIILLIIQPTFPDVTKNIHEILETVQGIPRPGASSPGCSEERFSGDRFHRATICKLVTKQKTEYH